MLSHHFLGERDKSETSVNGEKFQLRGFQFFGIKKKTVKKYCALMFLIKINSCLDIKYLEECKCLKQSVIFMLILNI